jgi:hypothetical protein
MTSFDFNKMMDGIQFTILEMFCVGDYVKVHELIELTKYLITFWDIEYLAEKWTFEGLKEYYGIIVME